MKKWIIGAIAIALTMGFAQAAVAPTVTLPATATVFARHDLTLTATVAGDPPPTLQWKTNGVVLAAATSNPLVYTNIQYSQSGIEWSLEATNSEGSGSDTTTVTVVGTQIMVVDFDDETVWAAYDLSTGAENTNGLTASASMTGKNYHEDETYWWNGESPSFNTDQTATWTVTGYTPGTGVEVYVHTRDDGWQGNGDAHASYVVNGQPAVILNHKLHPVADLTLNDGSNDHDFESLGQYVADGSGQIQVVLSTGVLNLALYTLVDAVAFEVLTQYQGTVFTLK